MYEIAIEETFDAAHCLRGYEGTCSRLHGHTYRVRAAFRFASLDDSGLAFDFRKAKEILRTVLDHLDHQYINDLPEFSIQNPSAEAIAKFIFDRVKQSVPQTYCMSVWETPTACATYFEDNPQSKI